MSPVALILLSGCVGSGDLVTRVSGQVIGVDDAPVGPGLVLVEQGPVHDGSYRLGTRIDDLGRFAVELPEGGTWGFHLFIDGYSYVPLEITLEEHEQLVITNMMPAWGVWMDLTGETTWPTQPDDDSLLKMPWDEDTTDNPVLSGVTMEYSGDLVQITAEVSDPTSDLSRMILAYDQATGAGFALNPPPPGPVDGNYPAGTYTMQAYLDEVHVPGASRWFFVVSDNACNDTDILTFVMPPLEG